MIVGADDIVTKFAELISVEIHVGLCFGSPDGWSPYKILQRLHFCQCGVARNEWMMAKQNSVPLTGCVKQLSTLDNSVSGCRN